MATEPAGDKRHVWGPRVVGALLPPLTRAAFRNRSAVAAQLSADWEAVVGPALAAVTQPRRLVSGTLTLACSGPIAMELQHMTVELMARINGHLGRVAVERLRFMQAVLPAPALMAVPPPTLPPEPLAEFAPGPLNDALARLGRAIASRAG